MIQRAPVERRILEAVMLVVAGCQKQPDARSSDEIVATATDTVATAAPPQDLTVAGDPVPTQLPNVVAGVDPETVCAQYKETVKVDTTRLKKMQVRDYQPEPQAQAYFDTARQLVLCTVIRSREDATIQVMRVPTCCPMDRSPCPPPYPEKTQGTRVVVERAELRPDGKVASSRLELLGFEKNPQGRHACGRQPEGLVLGPQSRSANHVGRELALMAELEAASVPAFERLARELAAHDAPATLVARAVSAAEDEVRHAHAMIALARAHGASPSEPAHADLGVRPLAPIAIENVVEGCVREAYGALVASFQSERADPALRPTFAAVAADERSHAALAEEVDGWIARKLDDAERARVALARRRALADLRASLGESVACDSLGLPDAKTAVALFDAYFG